MMGPADPMLYKPTYQLVFVILFIIFPMIYGFGRLTFYILWQIFRCMKYCLLGLYELLYADDFEESQLIEKEIRRRKSDRKRRKLVNKLTDLSEGVPEIIERTNGTVNRSSQMTQTKVNNEVFEEVRTMEIKIETDDRGNSPTGMDHSPTDDDDDNNSKASQTDSMDTTEDTKLRHRHVDLTNYPKELDMEPDPVISSTTAR